MRPLIAINALLLACLTGVAPRADAAPPTCFGERATIVGDARGEVINGTSGRDVIVAFGGDDFIFGKGGNDLICAGRGADHLYGGPGNDKLNGGLDRISTSEEDGSLERTGDTLRGGPGDDRMIGGTDTRAADEISWDSISWETSPRAVRIDLARGTASGDGSDTFATTRTTVVGSSYADVIDGSDRGDRILGGPGGDTIRGLGGPDVIYPDTSRLRGGGDDLVHGGAGNDVVESTGGDDQVFGGPGNDGLYDSGDSADVIKGGDGDDVVSDELTSNAGTDLVGGPGRDQVILFGNRVNPTAEDATASMQIGPGTVHFDAGVPSTFPAVDFEVVSLNTYGFLWTITGTPSGERVDGSGSRGTTFQALGGDDRFMGSAYDDTFNGGPGTDRNLGMGVGTNTCVSVEVDDDGTCPD